MCNLIWLSVTGNQKIFPLKLNSRLVNKFEVIDMASFDFSNICSAPDDSDWTAGAVTPPYFLSVPMVLQTRNQYGWKKTLATTSLDSGLVAH